MLYALQRLFILEARCAQILRHHLYRHLQRVELALGKSARRLPTHRRDLPLQVADPRFVRIATHDALHRLLRERDLAYDAMLLYLLRYQMPLRNGDLLLLRVARELDELHTV